MLDDLGLVHMNGRIYWALIGRFLSADQVVQDATYLQCYNRYSYCLNNPLRYTDPSGYISDEEARKKECEYNIEYDKKRLNYCDITSHYSHCLPRDWIESWFPSDKLPPSYDYSRNSRDKSLHLHDKLLCEVSSQQAGAATEQVSPATPNENSVPEVKSGEPDKLETAQTPKEEKPATKPADLNLFNSGAENYGVKDYLDDGTFVVAGHGAINGVADQRNNIESRKGFSASKLSEEINNTGKYTEGQDVTLYCCNTGVTPSSGVAFAQELANVMCVEVTAPNGVLFDTDHEWSVYTSSKLNSNNKEVHAGEKSDFQTFTPDYKAVNHMILEELKEKMCQ
jgi:RHS repeat-associated protein